MKKSELKNGYITKTDLTKFGKDLKGDLQKEINEDFKTHINVLYEKFHGDVKLVIERQGGL